MDSKDMNKTKAQLISELHEMGQRVSEAIALEQRIVERTAELHKANRKLQREIAERKRAETALRESEQKYRQIIEHAGDVIYTADIQGFCTYVNSLGPKLTGYSQDELIGMHFTTLVAPTWREKTALFYQQQLQEQIPETTFEFPIITQDGEEKWVEQTVSLLLKDDRLSGFQSIVRDITKRRETEMALRESEARYRDLFENATDIIQSLGPDGCFIYVNQRWVEALGYSREEAKQLHFEDILHPERIEHCQATFAQLQQGQLVDRMETVFITKAGQELAVEGNLSAQIVGDKFVATRGIFRDVTDRVQAENALRESEMRYRAVVEDQTEMICRFKPDGTITFVNEAYCRRRDQTCEELLGHNLFSFIPEESQNLIRGQLSLLNPKNPIVTQEHKITTAKGETHWEQWTDRIILDEEGLIVEYQAVGRDITDRKVAEEMVHHAALHDSLTGLPNRTAFMAYLAQALTQTQRDSSYHFALLFLDLDRFKLINDSMGHLMGDQLLITVARRLESCVRATDTVSRLGGDEFTILLDNIQDTHAPIRVAEDILTTLASPIMLDGHEIFTGTSIGIAVSTTDCERPDDLLRNADTAMYQAKAKGKGQYVLFDSSMHADTLTHLQLETDLRQALEREEFQVFYQPIVSLHSGQITGVEALIRWQHPQRGLITADEFIPIAEETGMIVPIGEWLLRSVCSQAQAWHRAGYSSLRISINLSPRQLQQQNLIQFIDDILIETKLDPKRLELEITENIAGRDKGYIFAVLHKLKARGVRISIDDFGNGDSSLEHLRLLSLNALKIDRSYLENIIKDENSAMIVTAIINLAHSLKLNVVAVGVETEAQLAFLQAKQCDEVQGYLFSQPVSAEAFTTLLQEKTTYLKPRALDEELELAIRTQTRQNVGYALVDEELTILTYNEVFNRWIEGDTDDLIGRTLSDFFPELVGIEDTLYQLAHRQGKAFTFPKVYRSTLNEEAPSDPSGFYFDLQIEPFLESGASLLITVADVTEQAHIEQQLRQELNELRLKIVEQQNLG